MSYIENKSIYFSVENKSISENKDDMVELYNIVPKYELPYNVLSDLINSKKQTLQYLEDSIFNK